MSTTEIIVVFAAAAFAALVKSTAGMGYPIVLLPVLALFIDISDAIILVAASNLALNAVLMFEGRRNRAESIGLRPFIAASMVGAVAGALLLPVLPGTVLRLMLVGVIAVFVVTRVRAPSVTIPADTATRWSPAVGGLAGLFQGAAGVSGPIVTPWFLSLGLTREAFVYSITAAFLVSGVAQIIALAAQGLFVGDVLWLGLALVPLVLVILPIGLRIRDRLSLPTFERVILVILVASGVSILVRMF